MNNSNEIQRDDYIDKMLPSELIIYFAEKSISVAEKYGENEKVFLTIEIMNEIITICTQYSDYLNEGLIITSSKRIKKQ